MQTAFLSLFRDPTKMYTSILYQYFVIPSGETKKIQPGIKYLSYFSVLLRSCILTCTFERPYSCLSQLKIMGINHTYCYCTLKMTWYRQRNWVKNNHIFMCCQEDDTHLHFRAALQLSFTAFPKSFDFFCRSAHSV